MHVWSAKAMRSQLPALAALLLVGCSPPVMFSVEADEPITGGELTLNGKSARLMKNVDGAYWAKWNGADADGFIIVHYGDRSSARCRIGYVTSGMTDIQQFKVTGRTCVQI
jgi:hypothetical protein